MKAPGRQRAKAPARATRTRWAGLWGRLGGAPDAADRAYDRVMAGWASPGRVYHTVHHLDACLAEFDAASSMAEHPNPVEAAVWLHDVCYDPQSTENEEESARFAESLLEEGHVDGATAVRVGTLIRSTKHQQVPDDPDARFLGDVDLAILAADPATFDAYEVAVRQEYHAIHDALFRAGRAAILERLLARPWIYATDPFRRRYEEGARANLVRSLARLRH